MILVIRSDPLYSIWASCVTEIITPSDPTRETDHLDHDSSEQSDRESNKPIDRIVLFNFYGFWLFVLCGLLSNNQHFQDRK